MTGLTAMRWKWRELESRVPALLFDNNAYVAVNGGSGLGLNTEIQYRASVEAFEPLAAREISCKTDQTANMATREGKTVEELSEKINIRGKQGWKRMKT